MGNAKAIIFDCFGVLVEASLEDYCDKYLAGDKEKLDQVKVLDDKANSGAITYQKFVSEMAKLAGIPEDEADKFLDHTPANLELLRYISDELQDSYKIGLLSNAADDWLEELFTSEQLNLFDDTVLSFEHGMVKPDIEIFKLSAQRLGVETNECIFIDDRLRYCDGAKRAGMEAICYKSFEQFKEKLALLLEN